MFLTSSHQLRSSQSWPGWDSQGTPQLPPQRGTSDLWWSHRVAPRNEYRAPAENPQGVFTLKTEFPGSSWSLGNTQDMDALIIYLFRPDRASSYSVRMLDASHSKGSMNTALTSPVSMTWHLLCLLPGMPFLPAGFLTSTSSRSPPLAVPDTYFCQVPTEATHWTVTT